MCSAVYSGIFCGTAHLARTIGVPIGFSVAILALLAAGLASCGSAPVVDPDAGTPKLRGERELLNPRIDPATFEEEAGEGRHLVPLGPFEPVIAAAAPGWVGQSVMDQTTDDWEPAVAFDPNGTYGYLLTTRYGAPKACNNCPSPSIWMYRSTDGGATWGAPTYLCACPKIKSQHDPLVEVAANGHVYAVWMNGFNPGVVFAKSTDHGLTWSAPKSLDGRLNWSDKPVLAVSADGQHVYVAFNHSDSYIAASHNGGATWGAAVKTNTDGRYYFAGGGAVLPNGNAVFTSSSFTQTSTGNVFVHVMRSTNGGASWTQTQVATTPEQPDCLAAGCPIDYYGTIPALAADAQGTLVLAYTGPTVAKGPQRIWARSSTDSGASWSAPVDLGGAAGSNSNFAALAATANGDFRMFYMQDTGTGDTWNTLFRRSTDGGATWTAAVDIADATSGPPYVTPAGFLEPYGDYGEIAVSPGGGTFATWGQGPSYDGPGGTWINRTS
ncbi:MAG: glycoside hydrolase [Sporichthyaceae bacterium]|nr:glycoside hydrolase [Sporichthyaceae bacterium]